mmetsp:Transcript_53648/g.138738  ORF Transcript_53648/g.138738 Transcript_53648/m.138738 type:complete len:306 (+) Transcript_53648:39-956(+)
MGQEGARQSPSTFEGADEVHVADFLGSQEPSSHEHVNDDQRHIGLPLLAVPGDGLYDTVHVPQLEGLDLAIVGSRLKVLGQSQVVAKDNVPLDAPSRFVALVVRDHAGGPRTARELRGDGGLLEALPDHVLARPLAMRQPSRNDVVEHAGVRLLCFGSPGHPEARRFLGLCRRPSPLNEAVDVAPEASDTEEWAAGTLDHEAHRCVEGGLDGPPLVPPTFQHGHSAAAPHLLQHRGDGLGSGLRSAAHTRCHLDRPVGDLEDLREALQFGRRLRQHQPDIVAVNEQRPAASRGLGSIVAILDSAQ